MNYALKELVGALRPRFTLLVGQSKHVGFRQDRLVWRKSVPKEPAWRVVLAELDSPNPVFSFGLLREEPADDQLIGTIRRYRPCTARRDSTGKQPPG
jgi:hypothetical protein